jgi:hypothetical protein
VTVYLVATRERSQDHILGNRAHVILRQPELLLVSLSVFEYRSFRQRDGAFQSEHDIQFRQREEAKRCELCRDPLAQFRPRLANLLLLRMRVTKRYSRIESGDDLVLTENG